MAFRAKQNCDSRKGSHRVSSFHDIYLHNMTSENLKQLEERLWEAADTLRANSPLRLNEFSEPVLGLIFLKFADVKFRRTEKEIEAENAKLGGRKPPVTPANYQARGVLFLPLEARFSELIKLPEGTNIGRAINDAMKDIEDQNSELKGVLPKTYAKLDNPTLISLLKTFNQIPDDIEGDAFGQIYEYFLGSFAKSDGSGGGEYFTPSSIVKLIVEIIEPYFGKIFDPACGSGGMFVQSYEFVRRHMKDKSEAARKISIYGQEKNAQTVHIAKINLAIHGLSGDIRETNSYYEDPFESVGQFDFVMANPPFNVDGVDKQRIKDDPRYPYGLPSTDNGNYLWIQIFGTTLSDKGRAGFVMANSAGDARGEMEIRRKIIEDGLVDVIVSVGPNMFYNVTLPVTLWFLDKGKKKTDRAKKVLFIDARNIFRQLTRRLRDFTPEQIQEIAGIVRSYREEEGAKPYADVKGLCKATTVEEIEKNGWSLNPGRYTGVADTEDDDEDFKERLSQLSDKLRTLNASAHELEEKAESNINALLS